MTWDQLRDFIGKIHALGLNDTKWLVNLNFKGAMNFTPFILILFGIPWFHIKTEAVVWGLESE